jgi:hypothetical protein
MAKIIKHTGFIYEVSPKNGESFQLDECQAIVGGFIEMVRTITGEVMLINEDGRSLKLPFNSLASSLYEHDIILGDVLVCRPEEFK